jgi:hypothetical protein
VRLASAAKVAMKRHSFTAVASEARRASTGSVDSRLQSAASVSEEPAGEDATKASTKTLFGSFQRSKTAIFNKKLLVERLELEATMTTMCPRFLLVIFITALLALSLEFANRIVDRGDINKLLKQEFGLEDLDSRVVSTAQVRAFMHDFARATSSFSPVSSEYVPDPSFLRLSRTLETFSAPTPLPAELRPRLANSFTLAGWVGNNVESWIVRAESRAVAITSGMQSCWACGLRSRTRRFSPCKRFSL